MMRTLLRPFRSCIPGLTFAVVLLSSIQATAAKEKILHEFSMQRDGTLPYSLVSDSAGNLYGATKYGGEYNMGAVFEFSPKAGGGWTETVLHSSSGGADGITPSQIVLDAAGSIYGTSLSGGTGCTNGGCGTVFKLSRNQGGNGWTETVIYTVTTNAFPTGAVVIDNAGNVYWAAAYFSNSGAISPSVSELTPSGGIWTETTVYTFTTTTPAYIPGLAMDAAGNLYGTLYEGIYPDGLVFELSPSSGGSWTEKTLYTFTGGKSGRDPIGNLLLHDGNLYGTTLTGGDYKCDTQFAGCGVAFELQPGSNGQWTESVLYTFPGLSSDAGSQSPNLSAFDSSGTLYGFTQAGGTGVCSYCGSVFALTPDSNGSWQENDLWDFTGQSDGDYPTAVALGPAGQVYGTNTGQFGGLGDKIFELTAQSGSTWTITVLYKFPATDGENPYASLVFDPAGNLYGTTNHGGTNYVGSIFEMSPQANSWKENLIYSFGPGSTSSYFGVNPSSLVIDSKGNLYGTAQFGGISQHGSVFELSPQPGGGWNEADLFTFRGTVTQPMGSVLFDNAGNMYGVTFEGGGHGFGSVFQLTQDSSGIWQMTVIHDFTGYPSDGAHPAAGLTIDSSGNLYGTTQRGGGGNCTDSSKTDGCGTVFELSYVAGSGWQETILYSFLGAHSRDGAAPMANLILDGSGNLYGTTYNGSFPDFLCGGMNFFPGCGTVFELSPSNGGWNETILYEFGHADGSEPSGGLVLDAAGNLYGMTTYFGAYGSGTLFKLSAAVGGGWTKSVLHNFGASGNDGLFPAGSLILDSSGNLYGVTYGGGIPADVPYGQGTVFEVTP
jgi:uncharacterized repeat protein (TIGR03803 family)